MAAIDNCVSSNYLRRACLDSSSVDGGGNVNKSNLCASINEAGCEFTFDDVSISGPLSVGGIATFSGAAFFEDNFNSAGVSTLANTYISDDLHVSGSSFFNNVTATGSSTFYDLTVTNETLLNNGTFTGDIKINNLTVTGTQYIEHRKDLYIGDPLITLNSGVAGANTYDIGWIGERGSSINVGTIWDESADQFALISTTDNGSTAGNVSITKYQDLKVEDLFATGRVSVGQVAAVDSKGGTGFFGTDTAGAVRITDNVPSHLHTANGITIDAGSVGIGTAAPSYLLDIQDHTGPATLRIRGGNSYDSLLRFDQESTDQAVIGYDHSSSLLKLNNHSTFGTQNHLTIDTNGYVGIGTDSTKGPLSVSGESYLTSAWITGQDGTWTQLQASGLADLSVTTASAGVPSLSFNSANGVLTYTPPATGSIASKTATDYVLHTETGCAATKSCDYFVQDTETGSMASRTATDYVLGTATGSMASRTATDYVLGTATGSAAPLNTTNVAFTGSIFGKALNTAQSFADNYILKYNSGAAKWDLSPQPGGGGIGGSTNQVQYNSAGSFQGSANLTFDGTTLTVSSSPVVRSADTGCAASKSCDYFVQDTETGSMASRTATNYVLHTDTGCAATKSCDYFVQDTETGSMASRTATDYVLGTATGSMASRTATNYVLGAATGCAASKTCEYFTGSLFGDGLKAGEAFADGYTPVWENSSAKWLLQANSAGGTPPGGSDTEIQFNNGGAFGGSSWFTANSATGFFTVGKADVGRWPADGNYAFFGHTDLNHALHNYALLQASDGTTFLSASTDKCLRFREGVTDVAMISGGAMRIGNGGLPSGTAGSLVVDNDVIAFYTSDERLKDNVAPIASGLNKISHLTGVQFDWNKDSYAHLQGHDVGVIAQNIEAVLPEAVSTRPDGYKAVRYDKIVPVLIEGMKEQQIQIQNLQTEVDNLKYWLESV